MIFTFFSVFTISFTSAPLPYHTRLWAILFVSISLWSSSLAVWRSSSGHPDSLHDVSKRPISYFPETATMTINSLGDVVNILSSRRHDGTSSYWWRIKVSGEVLYGHFDIPSPSNDQRLRVLVEFTDLIASIPSIIEGGYHCFKYTKKRDLSPPGSYK